ncbi:MAG: hypothetical protein QXW42_04415 [Thermofilum sp.]
MSDEFNEIFGTVKKEEEKKKEEKPRTRIPIIQKVPKPVTVTEPTPTELKPREEEVEKSVEETSKKVPKTLPEEVVVPKVEVKVTEEEEEEKVPITEVKRRLEEEYEIEVAPEPLELRKVPKVVLTIYGDKGTGKTWSALSLPGSILILDFDGQGKVIAEQFVYNKSGKEIVVFDARKYYNEEYDEMSRSGYITYKYIRTILKKLLESGKKPDWVVFDNTEIYHELLELAMRYVFGLAPYEGTANRNVWKLRKRFMRELHYLAYKLANKGVVYTCYPEIEEIVHKGDIISRKTKPKWIDIILYETNIVLYSIADIDSNKFYVKVESSKYPQVLKTGQLLDVTGLEGLSKYIRL